MIALHETWSRVGNIEGECRPLEEADETASPVRARSRPQGLAGPYSTNALENTAAPAQGETGIGFDVNERAARLRRLLRINLRTPRSPLGAISSPAARLRQPDARAPLSGPGGDLTSIPLAPLFRALQPSAFSGVLFPAAAWQTRARARGHVGLHCADR